MTAGPMFRRAKRWTTASAGTFATKVAPDGPGAGCRGWATALPAAAMKIQAASAVEKNRLDMVLPHVVVDVQASPAGGGR